MQPLDATPLQKGIEALQAGRNMQALEYFTQAIEQDPRNAQAWLGIASLVEEAEQKEYCYKKVLEIDPANSFAKIALQELHAPPEESDFRFSPPPAPVAAEAPTQIEPKRPLKSKVSAARFKRAIAQADLIRQRSQTANRVVLLFVILFIAGALGLLSWLVPF